MLTLPETVTPCNLTEIMVRADAATSGPWNDVRIGKQGNGEGGSHEEQIVNDDGVGVAILTHDGSEEALANTLFIANARTDVPAMVREIESWRSAWVELFNANIAIDPAAIRAAEDRMHALVPAGKP